MLVGLIEINRVGSTAIDYAGRTTFDDKIETRELIINTAHVISINEDIEMTRLYKQNVSRLETTRGSFTVLGNPSQVQVLLTTEKSKKVLRD